MMKKLSKRAHNFLVLAKNNGGAFYVTCGVRVGYNHWKSSKPTYREKYGHSELMTAEYMEKQGLLKKVDFQTIDTFEKHTFELTEKGANITKSQLKDLFY